MKKTGALIAGILVPIFTALLISGPSVSATTLNVYSLDDSGPGSLRDTLALAAPGDSIAIYVQGTIRLSSGKLNIDKNLQIIGPGVNQLILDGQASSAVCSISSNVTVSLSDLTITNGSSRDYWGNISHFLGGGVQNLGSLTMTRCRVTRCEAEGGGGIFNANSIILRQCSISGNSAEVGGGIGDFGSGAMVLDACVVNNNIVGGPGGGDSGGVYKPAGTLLATNSTISLNFGSSGTGGISVPPSANLDSCTIVSNATSFSVGGIAGSSFTCKNTLIAQNTAIDFHNGHDVSGTLVSGGYNLVQDTNGCTITGNTNGNIYGKTPLLGPLQDNGGPTFAHSLLSGSPAIDAGSRTSFPSSDQRGFSRPQDGNGDGVAVTDIGAFEAHGPSGLVVNSLADNGPGTLREAVTYAQTGDTISFTVQGIITLTNFSTRFAGELSINKNLQIAGPGPDLLQIIEQGPNPVFLIKSDSKVTLSGLTLTGKQGGGIQNYGNLTLSNCVVADCVADTGTGGIWSSGDLTLIKCLITRCWTSAGGQGGITCFGKLDLTDCTLTSCTGYYGVGGIYCSGPLSLRSCTISSNVADVADGGGIHARGGPVVINQSTISYNTASGDFLNTVYGGGIFLYNGLLFMTNSTVSGNRSISPSHGLGGGIYGGQSQVYLESCTVVSNSVWNQSAYPDNVPSPLFGGGIAVVNSATPFEARNNVIAGNISLLFGDNKATVASDCAGTMLSHGYNLVQNLSGLTITGDQTGCIFGIDPRLGPLRNNGGSTPTHALLPSSPAIDAGYSAAAWDQRGFPRPVDLFGVTNRANGSDIGAFEVQPGFIAIEAESGTLTAPMTRVSDTNASQGTFINSPTANSGTASYNITVPAAANYVIWCRVLAANYNSDSFFVSVDGGPELIYDVAENIQVNAWQWTRVLGRTNGDPVVHLNPRIFSLSAGSHSLVFRERDPNTKLDRFLITSDTNFVPVIGFEAESGTLSSPMAVASAPAASQGRYIASTVAESGQASFTFGIPATNRYFVWCRVLATNANADSFYVSMDGGQELIYDVASVWTNVWQWTSLNGRTNGGAVNFTPRVFSLDQSLHSLVFRSREANSKLDRILITSDPAFNPVNDFDQTITNQNISGFANTDLTIWLWENIPWRALASYKITSLPAKGTLYQYAGGARGSAISINSVVSDPSGRVIFSPTPNTCGLTYASFQFTTTDSLRDPAAVIASIDIIPPPVHIANWSVNSKNAVSFRFSGLPQTTYSVLESTNLTQAIWTQISSATEISSGLYEFVTPSATNAPARFFRIRWL